MSVDDRPTICLAMIVKNESAIIERCLRSVVAHVDSWVIVDTGSTDDTCERVQSVLRDLPGRLEHRPFVDFGHNRTELMELAYEQRADWLLLVDADMVLEVDGDLHELLLPFPRSHILLTTVLGGDPDIGGGNEAFSMPYLVRGNRHWRFEGVANEFLTSSGRPRQTQLPGVRFQNLVDECARGDKYERDRALLEAEHDRHPDDPRTLFYLAQAYRHLGRPDIAIKHYSRRAQMNIGWDEETFFAQYQVGLLQLESDWPHAVTALLRAWSMRPTRAEPLYYLAFGWRNREAWSAAYLFASRGVYIPEPDDMLFVDSALYRWGLRFERSVAAWYVGERDLARQVTKELLADPELPEPWRGFAQENDRLTI